MTLAVPRHVAIWIDYHQAFLLPFEAASFSASVPHEPGDGWSQCRVDAQPYMLMQQYYDAVLSYLEPQDEILVLGPGKAKRELRLQIEQQGGLKGKVVGIYYASKLAKVELVCPTSGGWPSEKAGKTQVASPIPQPALEMPERSRTEQ